MAALYLLPNKLGRPPLSQLSAKGRERRLGVEEGGWQECGAAEPRFVQDCPTSRGPGGPGGVVNGVCVAGGSREVSITKHFTAPGLNIRPLGGSHSGRGCYALGWESLVSQPSRGDFFPQNVY